MQQVFSLLKCHPSIIHHRLHVSIKPFKEVDSHNNNINYPKAANPNLGTYIIWNLPSLTTNPQTEHHHIHFSDINIENYEIFGEDNNDIVRWLHRGVEMDEWWEGDRGRLWQSVFHLVRVVDLGWYRFAKVPDHL